MAGAKIVVLYPRPTDVDAFERAYVDEHLPLARDGLAFARRVVLTRSVSAPAGEPEFHRMAEIYYDSLESLQQSLATPSTQEVARHAVAISTGGPPTFLICEEQVVSLEPAHA